MIAVADASPICYLILIGEIELLPQLFERVLLASTLIAELSHEDAPQAGSGLVDLASAIERLTKTKFRYSPSLLNAMIDRRRIR